jgi:hypothetical protein
LNLIHAQKAANARSVRKFYGTGALHGTQIMKIPISFLVSSADIKRSVITRNE